MRIVMLMLMLFALPAMADEAWTSDLRWSVIDALSQEGIIRDADVRASINAVNEAVAKLEEEARAELCGSKRISYESDPIGFVAVLESQNQRASAIRAAELAKLDQKLEQSGNKAEIDKIVNKVSAKTIDLATGRFEAIRNGAVSHLPQLNDMCGGAQ